MQQIEHANSSECLRDDVGEDGGGRAGVHWWLTTEDVVKLGEGVDEDEDICRLEGRLVPEDHPCCSTSALVLPSLLILTHWQCTSCQQHNKERNQPSCRPPSGSPRSFLDRVYRVGRAMLAGTIVGERRRLQ